MKKLAAFYVYPSTFCTGSYLNSIVVLVACCSSSYSASVCFFSSLGFLSHEIVVRIESRKPIFGFLISHSHLRIAIEFILENSPMWLGCDLGFGGFQTTSCWVLREKMSTKRTLRAVLRGVLIFCRFFGDESRKKLTSAETTITQKEHQSIS